MQSFDGQAGIRKGPNMPMQFFSSSIFFNLSHFFSNSQMWVPLRSSCRPLFVYISTCEGDFDLPYPLKTVTSVQMPPTSTISNIDLYPKLQICIYFLLRHPITTSSQFNNPKMESIRGSHPFKLASIPGFYSLREERNQRGKERQRGKLAVEELIS